MNYQVTRTKIRRVSNKIVRCFEPEKIILFGSWAWGKPHKDSDVDFFVIKKTRKKRRKRQFELRMKLFPAGFPMDLLVYTPEEVKKRLDIEDFFIQDILKKGKILYDRNYQIQS